MTSLFLEPLPSASRQFLVDCRSWDEFSINLLKMVCRNLSYVDTERLYCCINNRDTSTRYQNATVSELRCTFGVSS